MAPIDKFNGNLGNVNGFLFGKKVDKDDTTKTEAKKDVPVGQTKQVEAPKSKPINLNEDPRAMYTSMGLSLSTGASTEANMTKFFTEAPEIYGLKKEFGIPAEIDGLDEDLAAFLPAKALAYVAKMTPQQQDRIAYEGVYGRQGLDNVANFA